ncbi:MAG: hypothetical protein J7J54_04285 [Candidatus Omnitrophica bacterium]|nr:hypothetical protein [Candidatus Omnitrophota bacterium]
MKNQALAELILGILVIIFAVSGSAALVKGGNIILGIIIAVMGAAGMKKK